VKKARSVMNSTVRKLIPSALKNMARKRPVFVRHRSVYTNVFHCCVWKTGSQWLRRVLGNRRTFRYSGLKGYSYREELPDGADYRPIHQRGFERPFPERTIITPLYIDFENYRTIPKPGPSRAFFVVRDPRDVLVSWYFSIRYSHPSVGVVEGVRDALSDMPVKEGLLYCIDALETKGVFPTLRSWAAASSSDIKLVRFEDLFGSNNFEAVRRLFKWCDIRMPDSVLSKLLDEFSFERISGGRKRGQEDISSNYRRGIPGNWKELFDRDIHAKFNDVTGNLVSELGYE
jgi:hypothetical protein